MLAIPSTAKTYILDTNVLLHDADAIKKFQENIVVLPAEVLVGLEPDDVATCTPVAYFGSLHNAPKLNRAYWY